VVAAPFHAECAGHTAAGAEIFGGPDATGATAVPDPGCGRAWSAELSTAAVDAALDRLLGSGTRLDAVVAERGAGGYLTVIRDRATGRQAPADALVRALDAAAGHGVVRSGHLEWRREGGHVELRGRGLGHGVGLCQAGAARLAREGRGEREILAHYFPGATIGRR
jgi:stage II sporulation protein D